MLRLSRFSAVWVVWGLICGASEPSHADHPLVFPWKHGAHWSSSIPSASAPYRTLPATQATHGSSQPQVTIQQMSPKPGYAYGWFGSNSTPQLTRHLGYHQNYTQWKLTP